MDELKRLVNLVLQRGSKSSPFVNLQDHSNLETNLFNLIREGKVESDEEAAVALYGSNYSPVNYRMLKSRIRKKLLNQLHFLELSAEKFNEVNVDICEVDATLLEAQVLITVNEFKLADKLLTKVLSLTIPYGLVKKTVTALELKQTAYSNINNKKKLIETSKELQKYYELEAYERKALAIYFAVMADLKSITIERNTRLPEVPGILEELSLLWHKTKSDKIFSLHHILSIFFLELTGNYHAIVDTVARAEQTVKQHAIHSSWFSIKFNTYIRVYALLQTKQYEAGLHLAKNGLKLFDSQTVNWFAFLENYLLLALHSRKYKLAEELLQSASDNSFFEEIPEVAKERWELYRMYMLLLSNAYKFPLQSNLLSFVSPHLVTLPKDKAGFNLSLLVLDIVNSFSSESSDNYESRAERIRKYITKYLRGEKAERPRQLLRLLLIALKHNLDYDETREASENLYNKLSQTAQPGDAFTEVEIIPYEHLWEAILEILRRRNGQ